MKKFLILMGCLAIFLCGCGGNVKPTPSPTPTVTTIAESEIHQTPVIIPTGPYDNPYAPLGVKTKFTLTDAQQKLFNAYSKDFNFDISIFKGVAPIDVAQVFVECGLEGLWEGEYNLYYFDTRKVAKAQYKAESEQDTATNDIRTRRDQADITLSKLKDGKFVDEGNSSGYIEFDSYKLTADYSGVVAIKQRLHMKQVNDIWMIDQNRMFEEVS